MENRHGFDPEYESGTHIYYCSTSVKEVKGKTAQVKGKTAQ